MENSQEPDDSFDWAQLAPGLREKDHVFEILASYVHLQLSKGRSAGEIHEEMIAHGIESVQASAIIRAVQTGRENEHRGSWKVSSGPYDFGGVFERRETAEERREEREGIRAKSRQIAATEPDPAFALGELPTYAQVMAHDLNRRSRGPKVGVFVALLAVACFATLVVLLSLGR